ncbi:BRCA1 gene 1 protein [Collichthys lucidus]|uniref:BRCA1 gene 1 protein n=1 Tax=Collichthys lucidus TaxID=240159 RepID=A0A4U5VXS1_COLLU|nr:BRCA1 gene 1 protein [Collichthys lucidus]
MDFYINLKVNFRGNSKNFLLSGSETKSWESMEAMVSINSQVEYEEALKSAARQGNRLHMNVYETRGQPARVATTKASGTEPKRGFRPPQHCPALAQVVSRKVQAAVPEQGMVIMKEIKGTKEEDKTPPAWFTSYMEKFKDQVVREAVEKICREFSGQGQTTGGGYQCRFYRRGDRSFRKAEKQRLKAEKRLLKAEVKEIRKQLRMERRGIQWSSSHRDGSSSPVLLQPRATQHNSPERPKRPCPLVVPAMTAAFLDENLPDGTRLRPGTKFIKYWKMRNTGTISWSADTKVGIVSVALCAPTVEGSYTSHWRLAHAGEQFGPRVWCSIVVDPLAPAPMMADGILVSPCVTPQGKNPVAKDGKACAASREQPLMSVDQEEYFIPSVDLLTAQDLLSFELLDINIVQELESVPNNTPADVPHGTGPGVEGGGVPAQEEGEDDISGTQFVCETVIRSMTLEEAPDHAPLRGPRPGTGESEESHMEREKNPEEVKENEGEEKREGTRSRSSSTSSEDYIIILPDCFDTSRPLGESMYSLATSQPRAQRTQKPLSHDHSGGSTPDGELGEADEAVAAPGTGVSGTSSANDMLCTSQTLDDEPLTPEVVAPPKAIVTPSPESSGEADVDAAVAREGAEDSELYQTEDGTLASPVALVKGALSVAASAYKALFTGQGPAQPPVDASTQDTMMAVLVEMGFGDRPLNQRLLNKYNYNLLDVVNELVQMTDNDWKLYVAVSVGVCLLLSFLVLFFLFPRSVLLSPVGVKSTLVYFVDDDVQINITNILNITNQNFATVQAYNLTVQALNYHTVVGTVLIKNVTTIQPLSTTMYSFVTPVKLTDSGLSNYCKTPSYPVHILYLHLQMTMTVYYLVHYEQLSLESYEYIDCGANTTVPHSMQPPPP